MIKQASLISAIVTLILVLTYMASADVPQLISFQGKLYDNAGNPLTGQYEITFRIYNIESGGMHIWTETSNVSCDNGLYNVILGLINPMDLGFDGDYWLSVQVTGDNELSPRFRIVSVPVAIRAAVADSAQRVSWNSLTDVPDGFADGIDDVGAAGGVSQINAGDGITVSNPTGPTATIAADIGNSAGQVAAGDHDHDADYVNEGQDNSVNSGMIVDGTIQEDDVAFSIGNGDITEVKAGTGLSGGGTSGDVTLSLEMPLDLTGSVSGSQAIIRGINTGSGHGVSGSSVTNFGIYGISGSGVGVVGECADGAGVAGSSLNGYAGYFDGKSYFSGSVGIGTTNPIEELDVAGNIHASGTIASGSTITIDGGNDRITSSGELEVYIHSGRALRLESNAISPHLIGGFSGNNVNPIADGATIGGGGAEDSVNYVGGDYGTVGGGRGNSSYWEATVGGGAGNRAIDWVSTVGGGQDNEARGINATIGGGRHNRTSESDATVSGGAGNIASHFGATIGGGSYNRAKGRQATVPGGTYNSAAGNFSFAAGSRAKANHSGAFVWSDASVAIGDSFASTGPNQFLIGASGGVGIGTNSPDHLLHLVGQNPRILIESTSSNPEINLKNSGDVSTSIWSMYKHEATGDLRFYQNGDRVTIQKNTGNVGIGRTNPSYKLDVNGTIRGSNVSPSDARLKKEVVPIKNALERVNSLRGVNFKWKDEKRTHDLQMGVIAQEVEVIFPEAVSTDDDGYMSIAYERLVAPLIEAIKELNAENEALKERVEALESKLKE